MLSRVRVFTPIRSAPKRRSLRTSLVLTFLLSTVTFCQTVPAYAEKSLIRISKQHGIAFLPLMLMEHEKLVERRLAEKGLPDTKVEWSTFGGGASANEALIAGSADVVSGGAAPLLLIWDKTRNNYQVRGIGAVSKNPWILVSNNPAVHSIADLTEKDRIAMPAAGASIQAITLQMAAAEKFGDANWKKFDQLMVSLPNPDAYAALTSGASQITGHFSGPPFPQMELKNANIHEVLNSRDVLGGFGVLVAIYSTSQFQKDNPKSFDAIYEALEDAQSFIKKNPERAAEIYKEMTRSKEDVALLKEILVGTPEAWDTTPTAMMKVARFMQKTGRMKVLPSSWKELFFSNVQNKSGS